MTISKLGAFCIGAACGIVAYNVVKSPAFKKACASVVGVGLKLKDDAQSFAESVKEDVEDIVAEAKSNNVVAKA